MELKGTINNILNTETLGNPPKQMTVKKIVVKTPGKYPQDVAIDFLNKNIDLLAQFKVGDVVNIKVNLRSKEYKGKWYSNIIGWQIELDQAEVESSQQLPDTNDLPF